MAEVTIFLVNGTPVMKRSLRLMMSCGCVIISLWSSHMSKAAGGDKSNRIVDFARECRSIFDETSGGGKI